jgi:hypothetical protein
MFIVFWDDSGMGKVKGEGDGEMNMIEVLYIHI